MNIVVIQIINYTLSFLMWMIVGRGFLTLIVGNRQNIVLLAFEKVTEPVYRMTRKIFPFASGRGVPVLSFFLLAAVRVAIILFVRPVTAR